MNRFVNNVFNCNALNLLQALPTASIDAMLSDPMYMVATKKSKSCVYDWGPEPGRGTAHEFWDYHHRMYAECRRVLKPGGALAWAMGCKFQRHFAEWFGGHRIWGFSRFFHRGINAFGHIWMVQAREQTPIAFPDDDGLLLLGHRPQITLLHPCAKTEEEMLFMVRHLRNQGRPSSIASAAPALRSGCRRTAWAWLDRLRPEQAVLPDRHEQAGRDARNGKRGSVMKIAIVGLRFGQTHHVAKECEAVADLKFVAANTAEISFPEADAVILMIMVHPASVDASGLSGIFLVIEFTCILAGSANSSG